jgi:hypothetical protein
MLLPWKEAAGASKSCGYSFWSFFSELFALLGVKTLCSVILEVKALFFWWDGGRSLGRVREAFSKS